MNKGLTSFRALAFFSVFLFHVLVLPIGYLGVQAFFVLSGFLLTKILVEMKTANPSKGYFINFYGRRSLRIFPVYYLYLFSILALSYFLLDETTRHSLQGINRFIKQFFWGLTYTYNIYHASDSYQHTHLLSHFWSLAIEEQIYLFWPLVIFFTSQKHLKLVLLILILTGPILRMATAYIAAQQLIPGISSNVPIVVYVSPFSYLDAFATGGYFALYKRGGSTRSVFSFLALIFVIGMSTSWLYDGNSDWFAFGYADFLSDSYKYIWAYTLLNLFFAHMLCTLREGKFLPKLIEAPWLVYLGTISYGLYIFHNAFIWITITYFQDYNPVIRGIMALAMTIIVSAISYRLLEKPCIALKERFFKK